MRILEKYMGNKTYMFPNGSLATPEIMEQQFPAVSHFTHIIETDEAGEVCFAVQNLSAMRSLHNIDSSLSEMEAIAAIQDILNTAPAEASGLSAEERSAAALEAIAAGQTTENQAALDALLTGEDA